VEAPVTPEIEQLPTVQSLYEAAATLFHRASTDAIRERGSFSVALAGGSTPRGLYSLLADDRRWREGVAWNAIDFFWGDERHVPPDHPDSNYRMAHEALLSKVRVATERVHRVQSESPDASIAATLYEAELRETLAGGEGIPRLDLILLGLGTDGHTASLFPGTAAVSERVRLVFGNWVGELDAYRITMTLPVLNAARLVIFLVAGEEKAEAVKAVLHPDAAAPPLPAQLVRPADGRVLWLLDRAAGSLLHEIRT
jgi:6-phosphogluconolactonase